MNETNRKQKVDYSGWCNPHDAKVGRASHRNCRGRWSTPSADITCGCECHGDPRCRRHLRKVKDVGVIGVRFTDEAL